LFDDPGKVDFTGIDWIVVGTMTGAKSRTVKTCGVKNYLQVGRHII